MKCRKEANLKVTALAEKLAGFVREMDPTRPVTAAVNFTTTDKDPYFAVLDIAGYNYALNNYAGDHEQTAGKDHPGNRILCNAGF